MRNKGLSRHHSYTSRCARYDLRDMGNICSLVASRLLCVDRISSLQRADRKGIPLFSDNGGLVLRTEHVRISCGFGVDGETWKRDCSPSLSADCISGCGDPPDWCIRNGMRWRTGGPVNWDYASEESACFAMSKQGQIHPWLPVRSSMRKRMHHTVAVRR